MEVDNTYSVSTSSLTNISLGTISSTTLFSNIDVDSDDPFTVIPPISPVPPISSISPISSTPPISSIDPNNSDNSDNSNNSNMLSGPSTLFIPSPIASQLVIVWIASNYSDEDQFERLLETTKSCNALPMVYHIIFSIYSSLSRKIQDEHCAQLKKNCKSCEIKLRVNKYPLFQHYAMISNEFTLESLASRTIVNRNKVWITFCLDTDLLLPGITKYYQSDTKCFLAKNYVTANKSDQKPFDWTDWTVFENLNNILEHQADNMIIATDFSGTSCRFDLISNYFFRWIPPNQEKDLDIHFMKYLADNGAQGTEEPVALKLLSWTRDPWLEDIKNVLAEIANTLHNLPTIMSNKNSVKSIEEENI